MSELTLQSVERFVVNQVFGYEYVLHRIQIYMEDGQTFEVRLFSEDNNTKMEIGYEDYRA